jgi:hypothetical protein
MTQSSRSAYIGAIWPTTTDLFRYIFWAISLFGTVQVTQNEALIEVLERCTAPAFGKLLEIFIVDIARGVYNFGCAGATFDSPPAWTIPE